MQPARRIARIAVAVTVGALALTGCRSNPDVAAYVGDGQITEQQVTDIVDDAKQKIGDQGRPAPSRSDIVTTLVLGDVCQRLATEKGYQPRAQVSAEQVGQAFGLSADATYARETAELHSCLSGVEAGEPVAPTAEEIADLVSRGKAAGAIPPETADADAAARLDGEQLRGALATRKVLAEAASRYGVTVNPRYRPLEFPVLTFQGNAPAVAVPLGEGGSGAVTSLS